MYKIVRVGIPIQNKDISNQFLQVIDNIINDDTCIAVTTVDYPKNIMQSMDGISSPAGHKVLADKLSFVEYKGELHKNVINTLGFIGRFNGGVKHTTNFAQYLVNLLDDHYKLLEFKTVYIFTPGSPLYGDGITEYLLKTQNIEIIDTISSMQHSLKSMQSYLGDVDYVEQKYHDFVDRLGNIDSRNKYIDGNVLNIFNSLSDLYNTASNSRLELFLKHICYRFFKESDLLLITTVNEYETLLTVLTIKEMHQRIEEFRFSNLPFTVGIIKKDRI